MGFPTKNDHFGVFWGYQHFRKPPYQAAFKHLRLHINSCCGSSLRILSLDLSHPSVFFSRLSGFLRSNVRITLFGKLDVRKKNGTEGASMDINGVYWSYIEAMIWLLTFFLTQGNFLHQQIVADFRIFLVGEKCVYHVYIFHNMICVHIGTCTYICIYTYTHIHYILLQQFLLWPFIILIMILDPWVLVITMLL